MATVAELIYYLQQFDGDAPIVMRRDEVKDNEIALDIFFDLKS